MTTPVTPVAPVAGLLDREGARQRLEERHRFAEELRKQRRANETWYDQETRRLAGVAARVSRDIAPRVHAQQQRHRDRVLSSVLEHSPRRVAVDVRHDHRLDVEGLVGWQDIPAGELDGCPVTVVQPGCRPFNFYLRIAWQETPLGLVVLRSTIFHQQSRVLPGDTYRCDAVNLWYGASDIPNAPSHRVVLREPNSHHLALVNQYCTLWALGNAAGLEQLLF